jgi:hypothetical protein
MRGPARRPQRRCEHDRNVASWVDGYRIVARVVATNTARVEGVVKSRSSPSSGHDTAELTELIIEAWLPQAPK